MSWTFEGVEYHDYQALERARASASSRDVRAEVSALQSQAERHAARTRQIESQLERARGDLARTNELNSQLQHSLAEFGQTQRQLAAAQERFERQAEASFQELREHAIAAQQNIAGLEASHQAHVAETRQMFDQTHQVIAAGLAEAEKRRAAGEARLASEIAEVDRKFEEEKTARLAQARNEGERAAGLAAYVRERTEKLAKRQDELALHEKYLGLQARLEDVEEQLKQGRPAIALAVATSTYGDLRAAEKEADRRAGELEADRLWHAETTKHLQYQLNDAIIKDYFKNETADVLAQLQVLTSRLPVTHNRWDRLHAREAADAHLRELDGTVHRIVAAAPIVSEMDAARLNRMEAVKSRLESVFGELAPTNTADGKPWFEILNSDPKDDAIIRVHFHEKEAVDLHFPLDSSEPLRGEGHGHATRSACQDSATLVGRIMADMNVSQPRVDAQPRPGPQLSQQHHRATWSGLVNRLSELRRKL